MMDKRELTDEEREFLEQVSRLTPEERAIVRRLAIRLLTKQIAKERPNDQQH